MIVKFPEDKHAVEGQTVLLTVEVTGSPQPKLTWYHNGEEVVADYSRELAEDGSLTLPSAEAKHSGVYQLVAQNPAGKKEREVKLSVEGQASPNVAKNQQIELSAIAIDDFGDFVAQSHASNNSDFRDQYTVSSHPHTHTISLTYIYMHVCMHMCEHCLICIGGGQRCWTLCINWLQPQIQTPQQICQHHSL